jgi:hypothetical protein
VANRFCLLASSARGPEDIVEAERTVGMARFVLGDPGDARRCVEGMLGRYIETSRTSHMVRFPVEQRDG